MNRQLKNGSFRCLTYLLLFVAALAATALGCVWVGTPDSVRFNDYSVYRDDGRLPPLPTQASSGDGASADDNYAHGERRSRAADELWTSAETFEKEGKLTEERDRLLEYVKRTSIARNIWFDPTDREHRRNAAIDKLDALSALNQGSPFAHVQAYLTARTLHDGDKPVGEIENALTPAASDVNLKDNIAYLKAA